ncbi:MAG TPA: sigma 54-interacting transcriptional regulator [Candidatus Dormibacteraeota bacterium]|nr:sigma 54-interacting transcriptional regulator [Candidatus Dormibacteraeota bacterium]
MKPAREESLDLRQLQRDYTLSLRLLELGEQRDLEPFLREALALVVEALEARQGYLELHDETAGSEGWWIAHGFTDAELATVRGAISRGIIAEALATGQTIVTPSAVLDPRFGVRESVRRGRIEAVLCAPIGADPPRGVLYLQGGAQPTMFSDEERRRAEAFARHLTPLVDRVLEEHRRQQQSDPTSALRATLRLDGVIGRSPALAAALRQAALVAPLDVNVLITGQPGTGKTQLGRLIHDNGPRALQPFVELNCAAIPDSLLESELFGYVKGAFTGADAARDGKIRAAEGGTLMLDEVGELTAAAQAKLLQFLHSKAYYPLGATTPSTADVRVIAATNADLQQAVAEKRFREDLLFRLQVLPIRMPALSERRDDIAGLAAHFCAAACAMFSLPRLDLSPGAVRALEAAEWPGNVRQLDNLVRAAVIRASGAGVAQVERTHIFPDAQPLDEPARPETFQEATRRFQKELLNSVLDETEWNVVETARRLDLARSHVYNLIRAFGLERGR